MFRVDAIKRNAFVLFVGLTVLMLWTSCLMPLTLDEGNAILRSEKIGKWVTFFWNCPPGISSPLDWDVIQKYCKQTTQSEGHPAGYVLLVAAGHGLADAVNLSAICDEKTCCRLGPILLFCIALTAVYIRIGRTFGQQTAILSVLCILFMPRVFAHAHIAACDSPLLSCWLLAWALFEPALKSKRGAFLWGIVIGLGFSMKFPGWLIPIPFLIFAALELIRRQPTGTIARAFVVGIPTAVFVFYLLNPNLWCEPIEGFLEFVRLNTHRGAKFNIASVFLGQMYDLYRPLPWYNTLVWAGITIPVGLLFFLCCLGVRLFRKPSADISNTVERNRLILLAFLNFLPLMIARAIPGTPVHNGVRLFVAAFPFVGILAGLGASLLWGTIPRGSVHQGNGDVTEDHSEQEPSIKRPRFLLIRRILVVAILFGSGFNLYWYGPQWLSYYNLCIGGLPGAARAGMDVTYYWDGLDDETINWINEHTDDGTQTGKEQIALFSDFRKDYLEILGRWKNLTRADIWVEITPDRDKWLVFQKSSYHARPTRAELFRTRQPVYRKVIPRHGPGPWNLSEVPLIEIYQVSDYLEVEESFNSGLRKENLRPAGNNP